MTFNILYSFSFLKNMNHPLPLIPYYMLTCCGCNAQLFYQQDMWSSLTSHLSRPEDYKCIVCKEPSKYYALVQQYREDHGMKRKETKKIRKE
jgi:hypothetical protein